MYELWVFPIMSHMNDGSSVSLDASAVAWVQWKRRQQKYPHCSLLGYVFLDSAKIHLARTPNVGQGPTNDRGYVYLHCVCVVSNTSGPFLVADRKLIEHLSNRGTNPKSLLLCVPAIPHFHHPSHCIGMAYSWICVDHAPAEFVQKQLEWLQICQMTSRLMFQKRTMLMLMMQY
jgi:hypothetical protein